jgi:hypothetical protein
LPVKCDVIGAPARIARNDERKYSSSRGVSCTPFLLGESSNVDVIGARARSRARTLVLPCM